jgi:hypothetical protein
MEITAVTLRMLLVTDTPGGPVNLSTNLKIFYASNQQKHRDEEVLR